MCVTRALLGAVGAALLLGSGVAAQTGERLHRRIVEAEAERVAFRFAVEDGVTVCENGFRRGETDREMFWGRGLDSERVCPGGPLEVVAVWRGGAVRGIEMGPVGDHAHDVDLGSIDPEEAATWLLGLSRRGGDEDVAEEAMVGAVVARGVEPAPQLLGLVRDRAVPRDVRQGALFWLSDEAGREIDDTLVGIAADAAEDQEVRDAAVFALSRRPSSQAVPALMDLARTAPHAQTRRSALFWLSQSDDERVPDFFAELILGNGGAPSA